MSALLDGVYDADVVVVGGGIAGLATALGAGSRRVAVLSKTAVSDQGAGGSSVWAQGGIAAAVAADDSPALHAADTIAAGAGLVQEEAVTVLTTEGPARLAELLAQGARFDRDAEGRLMLGREAAHGRRRILHAHGDATGAEVVRAMLAAVARHDHVHLHGRITAEQLVLDGGRIAGVLARDAVGARLYFRAPAVVLATGGIGRLYRWTTNPPECTGDGLALAAHAGARLADLEFMQFHPTALAVGADPMPLLTEALRGEGAILVDGAGERFMLAEHPQAELAPRDVVARAIWRRRQAGDGVWLDGREAVGEAFPERFPTVFALCRRYGLDPRREPLPVSPAAHFHMGGVATDLRGRTSLRGLWACGELAATGVHGANRLASNSLLEGLVFGARVAADIGAALDAGLAPSALLPQPAPAAAMDDAESSAQIDLVREAMWRDVGLVRDAPGLRRTLDELARLSWRLPATGPLANTHTVARLVTTAALLRRESRGGHYRSDYPATDPGWRSRLFLELDGRRIRTALPWPVRSAAAAAGKVGR